MPRLGVQARHSLGTSVNTLFYHARMWAARPCTRALTLAMSPCVHTDFLHVVPWQSTALYSLVCSSFKIAAGRVKVSNYVHSYRSGAQGVNTKTLLCWNRGTTFHLNCKYHPWGLINDMQMSIDNRKHWHALSHSLHFVRHKGDWRPTHPPQRVSRVPDFSLSWASSRSD